MEDIQYPKRRTAKPKQSILIGVYPRVDSHFYPKYWVLIEVVIMSRTKKDKDTKCKKGHIKGKGDQK